MCNCQCELEHPSVSTHLLFEYSQERLWILKVQYKPMDEETVNDLSYDAYLLPQQSEKLDKIEQALKYYEQSLKWCEMLEGAEDSVKRLKEEIEGVKRRYGVINS